MTLKGQPDQAQIRQNLHKDVRRGSDEPAEENDPQPVRGGGAPPEEVNQREDLNDESPRVEEVAKEPHRTVSRVLRSILLERFRIPAHETRHESN